MIELNCSYEESKKILELGYDFSKVCLEFRFVNIYGGETYIKVNDKCYIHKTSIVFSGDLNFNALEKLEPDYIPLIPKAALEACLPDYLLEKGCNRHFSLFYHVCKFMGKLYWANSRDESLTDNWFNSAFEAFLWCHENYPEELKKKFSEVMT